MAKNLPCTVILVPASRADIERLVQRFRETQLGNFIDTVAVWPVEPGEGDYCAVLDTTPGAEGAWDMDLALYLSTCLDGRIYLLWPHTDTGSARVYLKGNDNGTVSGDIYDLARELGCTIPGAPGGQPKLEVVNRSACVVAGVDDREVLRAFKLDALPDGSPLQLQVGPVGTLVYSANGDVAIFALSISRALDELVYVVWRSGSGDLAVDVLHKGKVKGTFGSPSLGDKEAPRLEEIMGRHSASEVLTALGVETDAI